MAIVEIRPPKRDEAQTQSFGADTPSEARRLRLTDEPQRLRLTSDEQRTINYVLCGWDSEVGLGSNFGEMVSRMVAQSNAGPHCVPHHPRAAPLEPGEFADVDERREHAAAVKAFKAERSGCHVCRAKRRVIERARYCDQHGAMMAARGGRALKREVVALTRLCAGCVATGKMAVSGHSEEPGFRGDHLIERWGDKSRKERRTVLQSWRGLCLLSRSGNRSAVVLHALYGDMPPGLPQPKLWRPGVDMEYRRVVRYVESADGGGLALDELVKVDEHHGKQESREAWRSRLIAQRTARSSLLLKLGQSCEMLIERASGDYRAAVRAVMTPQDIAEEAEERAAAERAKRERRARRERQRPMEA